MLVLPFFRRFSAVPWLAAQADSCCHPRTTRGAAFGDAGSENPADMAALVRGPAVSPWRRGRARKIAAFFALQTRQWALRPAPPFAALAASPFHTAPDDKGATVGQPRRGIGHCSAWPICGLMGVWAFHGRLWPARDTLLLWPAPRDISFGQSTCCTLPVKPSSWSDASSGNKQLTRKCKALHLHLLEKITMGRGGVDGAKRQKSAPSCWNGARIIEGYLNKAGAITTKSRNAPPPPRHLRSCRPSQKTPFGQASIVIYVSWKPIQEAATRNP